MDASPSNILPRKPVPPPMTPAEEAVEMRKFPPIPLDKRSENQGEEADVSETVDVHADVACEADADCVKPDLVSVNEASR
jgi:hypothetical protein